MSRTGLWLLLVATVLCAQDGQRGSRPEWPCVPGRPADPAYIETSESTGGQLFLLQRNEAAHASLIMSAPYTHPATVLRAIGSLSGTRDFEFPVDTGIHSLLVMASLQCRNSIQVSRPDGSELTAANSARNVDLQAGRILQVDSPESGKWRLRLTGSGLFVLSVTAKTEIKLAGVNYARQKLYAHVTGEVSNLRFQIVGASGEKIADVDPAEPVAAGAYHFDLQPKAERFRIEVTGTDALGWPFQRTHPVLFRR